MIGIWVLVVSMIVHSFADVDDADAEEKECDECMGTGINLVEYQGEDGGVTQIEVKCVCQVDR